MRVAIQPDNYGPNDSSSAMWGRLLREAGHEVREINVYRADILQQLEGCHGFMWRYSHAPRMRQIARRLLPIIENQLGLVVYPDQNTCWHYDDKIAQHYLFETADIPAPKTWVWFEKESALGFVRTAAFPLVLKLCSGAGSTNVRLVRSVQEAETWINRLFDYGVAGLEREKLPLHRRLLRAAQLVVTGEIRLPWELHKNYVYLQEFLDNNDFDTRITVIGDRAFGFRRFNRANDFRASGSGHIDHEPAAIDPAFIELAFRVARKLGTQSCAIDGLWRDGEAVVGEISYTYMSGAVRDCPGHWDSGLNWHDGQMWPEEAQIQDFIARLEAG